MIFDPFGFGKILIIFSANPATEGVWPAEKRGSSGYGHPSYKLLVKIT